MTRPRHLTPAFEEALLYASRLHAGQTRKGSDIPYVTHLMSVAALVLEFGGTQEQAIAGLLHDAIEDQAHGFPDRIRSEIQRRFSDEALRIVEACTDTDQDPKPAWRIRKQQFIERLSHEDSSAALVAIADKLHNARTMLADYRVLGDELWSRFNAKHVDQAWYLRAVADAVVDRVPRAMLAELAEIVERLNAPPGELQQLHAVSSARLA